VAAWLIRLTPSGRQPKALGQFCLPGFQPDQKAGVILPNLEASEGYAVALLSQEVGGNLNRLCIIWTMEGSGSDRL